MSASDVRLTGRPDLIHTRDVGPAGHQAPSTDGGETGLLDRNLGNQRGAVKGKHSQLMSGGPCVEEQQLGLDVGDVVACLVVARILLGQDARLQEPKGLVENGPERGVVAAVGQDARCDLYVLGGKVVEVGLLDDFGA